MVVAASPRIYMGRCPKVVFKSPVPSHQSLVTSHQSLVTSHLRLLIPSHQSLYLYLIKVLDSAQCLAVLKEGLGVNEDGDSVARLAPEPDGFFTG